MSKPYVPYGMKRYRNSAKLRPAHIFQSITLSLRFAVNDHFPQRLRNYFHFERDKTCQCEGIILDVRFVSNDERCPKWCFNLEIMISEMQIKQCNR